MNVIEVGVVASVVVELEVVVQRLPLKTKQKSKVIDFEQNHTDSLDSQERFELHYCEVDGP